MANNYFFISEKLYFEEPERHEWWKQRIVEHEQLNDEGIDQWEDDDRVMEFTFELEDDGLWVYSDGDDTFNLDSFVHHIQAYLKKFDPILAFDYGVAWTCSKPRIGEFGGGQGHITATSHTFCDGACTRTTPPEVKKLFESFSKLEHLQSQMSADVESAEDEVFNDIRALLERWNLRVQIEEPE